MNLLKHKVNIPIGKERKLGIPLVLISVLVVLLACCCCLAWAFVDSTLRETGILPTYVPTETPTASPTPENTPTATPKPTKTPRPPVSCSAFGFGLGYVDNELYGRASSFEDVISLTGVSNCTNFRTGSKVSGDWSLDGQEPGVGLEHCNGAFHVWDSGKRIGVSLHCLEPNSHPLKGFPVGRHVIMVRIDGVEVARGTFRITEE